MAYFLLVDDPDASRREHATRAALRQFRDDRGLRTGSFTRGEVAVIWGTADGVPVVTAETPDHTSLLIGDAIPGPGPERITAEVHGNSVCRGDGLRVYDGIHIAVTLQEGNQWCVAGDLLGVLPVYHTAVGDAILVASTHGLLGAHADFSPALDPLGLATVLLINSPVGGRTILNGVRRLAQGHVLRREAGEAPREVSHYVVPVTTAHHDVPLAECSHRLHEALVDACRRQVQPGGPHTLLLSGGLDSRLLAGILARLGVPITAVTRGIATDNDYRFAHHVARRLGFAHRLITSQTGGWNQFLENIHWHGMASSPGMGAGGVADAIRGIHPRVVSGYLMDAIVGGSHIAWCFSPAEHAPSFEALFHHLNSHAVPAPALKRLLRRSVFGDSVDEALHLARSRYHALGDSHLERAWRFDLEHRQRISIGTMIVRQTEAAWPALPHIDRAVLETAGAIPFGMLAERVVERDIVIRHHNQLASLPLDRNSSDTSPLDPGLRGLLGGLPRVLARRAAGALRLRRREDRYYYRTFDMDGPAWRGIRMEVEARRDAAHALFEPGALRELLPPPGEPWPPGDRLRMAFGMRLLLGTVGWIAGRASPGAAGT